MKKLLSLALALTMLFSLCACSKDATSSEVKWPEKTIEIICPYSAGGGSDTMARSVANALTNTGLLSQTVIVTNKSGGNGMIGSSYVASRPDDQYTFVTNVTGDLGAWVSAGKELTPEMFKPVAMFCWDCYVLVVKADSEYNSISDLIEASKGDPGLITIAGTGIGTVDNILYRQMVEYYGLEAEYVAYDGGGDVVTSILGGHVTANWVNPSEATTYVESGDMKALAVAGDTRLEAMPNLPCTAELGFDKIMWRQYRGIFATKNTPDAVIEKLVEIMKEACASDYFQNEYLDRNCLTSDFKSGAEFQQIVDETWEELQEVIK